MNDRELLELAAKAAGVEIIFYDTHSKKDVCAKKDDFGPDRYWNPLIDDGDALRLAVKIYMFDGSLFDLFLKFRLEEVRVDGGRGDEEIVRRAIVRVAAEIGRNMK